MTSRPITMDEYKLIIQTMYEGGLGFRPNPKIALLLQLEASCGLRVSDSKNICLNNIYKTSDNHYRLKVKEKKTGKHRDTFFFEDLYYKLSEYCIENGIKKDEPIFKITTRQVNKYLAAVVSYLDLGPDIGTHSFRKLFSTELARLTDLHTVSIALNHSNINTTVRYIAKNPNVDAALEECGSKLLNIEVTNK